MTPSLGAMLAREIAPEIDRLVLSVSRAVGSRHRERLAAMARACGLESLELLPHYESFLIAGTLTPELATLRSRYRSPQSVLARLEELERKGLVAARPAGIIATATLRPLLGALLEIREEVCAALWGDHAADVGFAADVAAMAAAAITEEHLVAVAHRALPEPPEPFLLLEHRLLTLRFARQHDHAEAWLARELTAPQMVVLTELWRGHATGEPGDGFAGLVARGYATGDPPAITEAGRTVRLEIEAETDERAQQTFDALDDSRAVEFLAALRRLPGEVAP